MHTSAEAYIKLALSLIDEAGFIVQNTNYPSKFNHLWNLPQI